MVEKQVIDGIRLIAETGESVVLTLTLAKLSAEAALTIKSFLEKNQDCVDKVDDQEVESYDVHESCRNISGLEDVENIQECKDRLVLEMENPKYKDLLDEMEKL